MNKPLLILERQTGETALGYEWIEVNSFRVELHSCGGDYDGPLLSIICHVKTDRSVPGDSTHGTLSWDDIANGIRFNGYQIMANNLPIRRTFHLEV